MTHLESTTLPLKIIPCYVVRSNHLVSRNAHASMTKARCIPP